MRPGIPVLAAMAVLVLASAGRSFMPGGRYTATRFAPAGVANGHGQLTRDAIRDGRILEASSITRGDYEPACWAHMYPKLPPGMSRWPNLTRAAYPDIFKFEDELYRGSSHEAHDVYRNGMLVGARKELVWVTDPRDHAQEYRVVYDIGSYRHAYMAMGYRVHCEQDMESPAHQKVIFHAGSITTGDRLEIFSGIDPGFWNYSSNPDSPKPLPADASMPFTPEQDLPVWLADVEDDDDEDDQPDAPGRLWSRDRPFDPGRLDGPATTPDGGTAYWHRGNAGEILPDGSRPPVAEEILFREGIWGTYGGHPADQPPGLNGGTNGSPIADGSADRAGDFFCETLVMPGDLWALQNADDRWRTLFGRVTLRAKNRTIKALIEMSHSLPPVLDAVTPTSGAVMRRGKVFIPHTAANPKLTFRVSDNRSATLKTLRVYSDAGLTKKISGRLRPTPDSDTSQLPFARVFEIDLDQVAPSPATRRITIEIEDADGHWVRDFYDVERERGPWDVELEPRVTPDPVIAGNAATFLTKVNVRGARAMSGSWNVRHRLSLGAFEEIRTRSYSSPPREFGSEVSFTLDATFAGQEVAYDVEVTPPRSTVPFKERRTFRVRDPSRAVLSVRGIEVTPHSLRAGDAYTPVLSYDVSGLAPSEQARVVWTLWLEGATRKDLPGFDVTVGNGPYEEAQTFTVDSSYRSGDYTLHARATLADGTTVGGISNPFRINLSPVRILSVSVQPVGATEVRRGGKVKVQTRYELVGPAATGDVDVTERHVLSGPVPQTRSDPPRTLRAGAYEYEHEVPIPVDAPLGAFECVASVTASGHPPETERTTFSVEAGLLRFDSLKVYPNEVAPGETAWFVAAYRRLDIRPGQTVTIERTGSVVGPASVPMKDSTDTFGSSGPREWPFSWKVPADQVEGDYRLTLRLAEGSEPAIERSVVLRVSKTANPTTFFLRIVKAWSSTDEHGSDKRVFRYGDQITVNGRADIREYDPAATMFYSFATTGPEGPVPHVSLAETEGRPPAAGLRHVWITRKVILPELVPGDYVTKVTMRVKNRLGAWIVRSREFRWEIEDPIPEVDLYVSKTQDGPKRQTLLAGDPFFIQVTPKIRGIPAATKGRLTFSPTQGSIASLPHEAEWTFSPGRNRLYLERRLATDQREGTYRVRGRVTLDLFPGRPGGSYWRQTEHEFRVVQPIKNVRLELTPDPVEPGARLAITVRYDVQGIESGDVRDVKVGWRTSGDWVTADQRLANGARWYRWTPTVADDHGEFIDVQGFLRYGDLSFRLAARVRVRLLPTMTIRSPGNGTRTNQRVITVSGTCADKSVTRGEFWHNGQQRQLEIRNGSWSAKVRLQRGNNTIRAQASNRSGTRAAAVTVVADIPQIYLLVRMTWDQKGDVDLWVTDPERKRTWYKSQRPAPNRWLDVDNKVGYGPEIYTMEQRLPGRYVIRLQYYSGNIPTWVTLQVRFPDGSLRSRRYQLFKGAQNSAASGSTIEIPIDVR